MKKAYIIPVLFFLLCLLPLRAEAAWEAGVSISDGGIDSFYLSVGNYYNVPRSEITHVRGKRIPDDEMPVVFFLSQRSGVSFSTIVDLRLGGKSWLDITLKYGLGPDIFYVPVKQKAGPPYGKAYGYYKNKPKSEWNSIKLSDTEITDFVNLKFISEHHGISADEVIKMRGAGTSFVNIDGNIKKGKGQSGKAGKGKGNSGNGNGKGKGKGKNK